MQNALNANIKKVKLREFPGSPVVSTPRFHLGGTVSIPKQGTKIPPATHHGQKTEWVKHSSTAALFNTIATSYIYKALEMWLVWTEML